MTEEWQPIPGYVGLYEASSLGRIRSLDRMVRGKGGSTRISPGRLLVLNRGTKDYLLVRLYHGESDGTRRVHRLVCHAFHGAPPPGRDVVRHLNGNPADNRPENLAWGTTAENAQDALRHGTNHNMSKTHCKYDHEFTAANTRITKRGTRACRKCHSIRQGERQKTAEQRERRRIKAAEKAS